MPPRVSSFGQVTCCLTVEPPVHTQCTVTVPPQASGLEDVWLPLCSLAAASVEQLRLCDRLLDEPDRGVVEAPHLSRALRLCDRLLDELDRGG